MITAHRVPDVRTRRLLDAFLVAWVIAWVVLALVVGREVRGLEDLSRTTVTAGQAVDSAGAALEALGRLPLVGANVRQLAEQARAAGRSAVESGRSSRDSIHDLSILLALAVALVPTLPLLALYLPLRVSWHRQVEAVRRALARRPGDPALVEFLARRAVQNLPYDVLYETTDAPWRDLEAGRYGHLAAAELRRLGLHRRYGSAVEAPAGGYEAR
jgi:hypothetical protein